MDLAQWRTPAPRLLSNAMLSEALPSDAMGKESLFAASLLPYLVFLWFAWNSRRFPRLALLGFTATLLFVAVTIVAALIAQQRFGAQLADVDSLHGSAEAFLTISNLLVLWGFSRQGPDHCTNGNLVAADGERLARDDRRK